MNQQGNAQLRQRLLELLGPRRFRAGESQSARVGTAWPASVADVQQILTITREAQVPIFPRGATSSPFARPEPEAGLAVAFDYMTNIGGANLRTRTVRVQTGVIWHSLIERLAPAGLMPRTYPSSEGYSTVGGFVAQSGVGIGSYEFGDIGRNLASVRVVDASGTLRRLAGRDLPFVVGAEGRTGVVVDVTLRLQERAPMVPTVGLFDSLADAERSVAQVAGQPLALWSVHLLDPAAAAMQSQNWPALALPGGKHAVLFAYREDDCDTVLKALREIIAAASGELLDRLTSSSSEWLVQFASLMALGTTPVPMQYQLPPGRLSELFARIEPRLRARLALEAVAVAEGKTLVARLFFVEPVAPDENARVARELLGLAKEAGGGCYTTGALYLDQAEAVFGADRLAELQTFHQTVDPDNRLNPGRGFK